MSSTGTEPRKYPQPEMPPPPYFKTHLINPSAFKAAINKKLDTPVTSLFRLCVRVLQLAFSLASGISYAIELHAGKSFSNTNLIYSQVVFGLTIIYLVIDSVTARYYRISWFFEGILAVLWFACFGVFYVLYIEDHMEEEYQAANIGQMKRAVWCDLINAMLWMASAIFSSAMCCTGVKAAVQSRMQKRREKKGRNQVMNGFGDMESGVTRAYSA